MAPEKGRPGRDKALAPADAKELCAAFLAGRSRVKLSIDYGIGLSTVGRILAEHGVTATQRRPVRGQPRPETRADFEALGEPPEDPIKRQEWAHRALGIALRQCMTDVELDSQPADRRRELVSITRAMSSSLPAAVLSRTKRLIKEDAEDRDGAHRGPEMEPPPERPREAIRAGRPRRTA